MIKHIVSLFIKHYACILRKLNACFILCYKSYKHYFALHYFAIMYCNVVMIIYQMIQHIIMLF